MKIRLYFALLAAALLLPMSALAQKTAYGYTMYPATSPAMISFTTDNPSSTTTLGTYGKAEPRSGAAVKGKLYMMGIDDDFYSWFYTMDLTTGESETIKKLGDITIPTDMTYDYTTETMYSIANSETVDGVSALSTVDLETGKITCVCEDLGQILKAIAIDARGQLYGLNKAAVLFKVNKETGEMEQIGATGVSLATWFGFHSMEFDRETGTLYLAAWTSDEKTMLYTIDTATARATLVGAIGNGSHTVALAIPYQPAGGLAPDKVTEATITADEDGELQALLTWVNPANDYSGNPLEGTITIEIVNTVTGEKTVLEDCQAGEAMRHAVTVDEAGMYEFTLVAVNDAGASLEQYVEAWIGHDVPAAVGNAKAKLCRTQYLVNELSWETPATGAHGGYLDKESLKYDVVRMNDGKTIAADLTATSLNDTKLIDELTRYSYKIVAKNDDGEGESVLTNDLVNGPAVECPYVAPFNSWEESGQYWTVLDGNDDKYPFVWYNDFMNMFGQGYDKGYYIYQKHDVFYAFDFIISPPISFTEGHEYKITATVSNDDIAGYREESFLFYTFADYSLDGATPLGYNSFTVKHPGEFRDYSLTFTVEDDGLGTDHDTFASFIALCCNSHYDMGMLLVSSMSIEDLTPEPQPVTGDVNGDGNVNISDVNVIIDMILSGKYATTGDVNSDGNINISDVNAIIAIILAS